MTKGKDIKEQLAAITQETVGEEVPRQTEQPAKEKTGAQAKKSAPRFVLRGAASFRTGNATFIKGEAREVTDPELADRLRKSGLFEEE